MKTNMTLQRNGKFHFNVSFDCTWDCVPWMKLMNISRSLIWVLSWSTSCSLTLAGFTIWAMAESTLCLSSSGVKFPMSSFRFTSNFLINSSMMTWSMKDRLKVLHSNLYTCILLTASVFDLLIVFDRTILLLLFINQFVLSITDYRCLS